VDNFNVIGPVVHRGSLYLSTRGRT
jgi:hypothetical protein